MQFSAKRDDLSKALGHVQSIVEKRAAIPALGNVKLTANGSSLELVATDMDICYKDQVAANVNKPICTTVPASTLYEIVRKISDNCDVTFVKAKDTDDIIDITIGSSEFRLPTINADEFPSFESIANPMQFTISSEILRMLLAKTKHAVSNEETRYYLNGIYMHTTTSEDGVPVLRCVATDGHRLARAQTILPDGVEQIPGIIIPKKAVNEVVKLLEDYVGDVKISVAANKIMLNIGTAEITSKLIDGKFPDYERVIPKNNDKDLRCNKKQLVAAIDLVISVSSDRTKAVKFNITKKGLNITATSELNGNARGEQDVEGEYQGNEDLSIGFNSRYVLDALSAIEGDTVEMTMSSNLGAVIARDKDDVNFIYILMPMQV